MRSKRVRGSGEREGLHGILPSAGDPAHAPGPIIADFYGSIAGVIAMLFAVVAPKLVPAEPDP